MRFGARSRYATLAAVLIAAAACGSTQESPTISAVPSSAAVASSTTVQSEPPATVDLSWTTVPLPGPTSGLVGEVVDVNSHATGITAVGYASGIGLQGEALLVWGSADGRDWLLLTPEGLPRPGESRFMALESGGAGYLGVTNDTFFAGEPVTVWTSPDALAWSETPLPVELGDNDRYIVRSLVATDRGLIVVGSLVTTRPSAKAGISRGGLTLILDVGWTVVDGATGAIVDEGDLTDIYPIEVDPAGAQVRDPASEEILVVIPWDVYEERRESTGVFTAEIEYEGWLLLEDESNNSYSVVEVASGEEVVAGANQNYLAFGPDPELTLADGRSFAFTWDELDAAWRTGIEEADALDIEERNDPLVFHSTTGDDFEAVTFLPLSDEVDGLDVYWINAAPGDDGFIAVGSNRVFNPVDGVSHPIWTTWRSQNGLLWEPTEVENHPGLYGEIVAAGTSSVLVAGHDGRERYIASSSDALTWALDYEVVESNLTEWMWDAAVGSWTSAAVGTSESPFGFVAELFLTGPDGVWSRATLPIEPLDLQLTEVVVTEQSLVLGGSQQNDRRRSLPVILVATPAGP